MTYSDSTAMLVKKSASRRYFKKIGVSQTTDIKTRTDMVAHVVSIAE